MNAKRTGRAMGLYEVFRHLGRGHAARHPASPEEKVSTPTDGLRPDAHPATSDNEETVRWWLAEVSGPLCVRYPSMRRLRAVLLAHGGKDVVFHPCHLHDAGRLLKRGRFITGPKVTLQGKPNLCHFQAAGLYALGAVQSVLTGFVLDGDSGFWLQHSFGMTKQGEIVETCEPQAAYFAATLTEQEIRQLQFMTLFGPIAGILL